MANTNGTPNKAPHRTTWEKWRESANHAAANPMEPKLKCSEIQQPVDPATAAPAAGGPARWNRKQPATPMRGCVAWGNGQQGPEGPANRRSRFDSCRAGLCQGGVRDLTALTHRRGSTPTRLGISSNITGACQLTLYHDLHLAPKADRCSPSNLPRKGYDEYFTRNGRAPGPHSTRCSPSLGQLRHRGDQPATTWPPVCCFKRLGATFPAQRLSGEEWRRAQSFP